MKRKAVSNLEFQAKECMSHLLLEDTSSSFSPCDVICCTYEYPLKILLPDSASNTCCQWVYPITFGGGLVEGDEIDISVKIGSRCCVLMTTLSFQKVYCCENGLDSQQHMTFDVHPHALLCVLPDPLVCYKKASYIQTQSYYLQPQSNVVALDWFTSGRYERGERWNFSRLKSVSSFYMNNNLAFKEAQHFQNTPLLSIQRSMKSYNMCGNCVIIGPYLSFLFKAILKQLGKSHSYGEKYTADTLFAVSPLQLKGTSTPVGCIIRFASESVTEGIQKIETLLEPLFEIIGSNPWKHK